MTAGTEANPEVRDRLAIPLDRPDLDDALRLARDVSPWFGVAKIGLELYSAAGPEASRRRSSHSRASRLLLTIPSSWAS